ncbi:GINS complex subunit 1 [Cladophialophora yegresii CBS 114405]|uniref:DNA replication complex GINS protein PSF1 n=1 Tax=Cladophialophora yegresii CBS 114405 TaxID=1182544 RepID=W9VSZ4_9EURO|nr:GINS complex subunit 1 [Cladophialophora yegresii CBS 114405]EXJ58688.1 GINS complex subunit 1 [Cladophialophora yegresii CBS 114405]
MHGELGNKLVQHAKRTLALPALPAYQTELIRSIVLEVRDLDRDVTRLLAPFTTTVYDDDGAAATQNTFAPVEHPATACALLVDHLSMRRNKRCLLAYHRVRAEKLESMVWEGRELDVGAGQEGEKEREREQMSPAAGTQNSVSPEEASYFHAYSDFLGQYKAQWTDVDLTGSLEPPRDLFIDVRVLKDAGEIQTEYGAINLTKNSQFFVRKGDVERLIQAGFLMRLT